MTATPLNNLRAPATANTSGSRELATPQGKFNDFLTKHKGQLAAALPKHVTADRMARLAMTAFSQSKQLQDCEPKSIFAGVVLASQMGLEIGVTGQGYLVPYKKSFKDDKNQWQSRMEAQFIPGWQGIVDLVSRTGRATVWTGAVFEGDDFDYALGDRPFVKHRPNGEDDPAKLLYVYAVGRVNGSDWPVIEVWPMRRVLKHRDKNNKVGKSHYSYGNVEMYARKIPLLQVCKYMPKSVEITAALNAEYAAETGRGMTFDGEFSHIDPPQEHGTEAGDQGSQRDDRGGDAGSDPGQGGGGAAPVGGDDSGFGAE